jgi:competence protein ComFC
MLQVLLDLVFPRRCASCGSGPWPFCPDCDGAVVMLSPPWCRRCGRPSHEPLASCRDCPPRPIATARAPFLYDGPARSALHRLKFSGWRTVASALSAAMAEVCSDPVDVVTWVPLAPARRARRGYDQARALALGVAAALEVPARPLLERTRDTPAQARRSGAERRQAMRGAFRSTGRGPPPGRILLVDDVLTTGSTAAECASVLTAAGAASVGLLVAARALARPLPARCYTPADSRLSLWLPGDRPR